MLHSFERTPSHFAGLIRPLIPRQRRAAEVERCRRQCPSNLQFPSVHAIPVLRRDLCLRQLVLKRYPKIAHRHHAQWRSHLAHGVIYRPVLLFRRSLDPHQVPQANQCLATGVAVTLLALGVQRRRRGLRTSKCILGDGQTESPPRNHRAPAQRQAAHCKSIIAAEATARFHAKRCYFPFLPDQCQRREEAHMWQPIAWHADPDLFVSKPNQISLPPPVPSKRVTYE